MRQNKNTAALYTYSCSCNYLQIYYLQTTKLDRGTWTVMTLIHLNMNANSHTLMAIKSKESWSCSYLQESWKGVWELWQGVREKLLAHLNREMCRNRRQELPLHVTVSVLPTLRIHFTQLKVFSIDFQTCPHLCRAALGTQRELRLWSDGLSWCCHQKQHPSKFQLFSCTVPPHLQCSSYLINGWKCWSSMTRTALICQFIFHLVHFITLVHHLVPQQKKDAQRLWPLLLVALKLSLSLKSGSD